MPGSGTRHAPAARLPRHPPPAHPSSRAAAASSSAAADDHSAQRRPDGPAAGGPPGTGRNGSGPAGPPGGRRCGGGRGRTRQARGRPRSIGLAPTHGDVRHRERDPQTRSGQVQTRGFIGHGPVGASAIQLLFGERAWASSSPALCRRRRAENMAPRAFVAGANAAIATRPPSSRISPTIARCTGSQLPLSPTGDPERSPVGVARCSRLPTIASSDPTTPPQAPRRTIHTSVPVPCASIITTPSSSGACFPATSGARCSAAGRSREREVELPVLGDELQAVLARGGGAHVVDARGHAQVVACSKRRRGLAAWPSSSEPRQTAQHPQPQGLHRGRSSHLAAGRPARPHDRAGEAGSSRRPAGGRPTAASAPRSGGPRPARGRRDATASRSWPARAAGRPQGRRRRFPGTRWFPLPALQLTGRLQQLLVRT